MRDYMLDEPDELRCRDCYDEEHKPKPVETLSSILEEMGLEYPQRKRHRVAAKQTDWFRGFSSWLDAAYSETVDREEWGTCAAHADAARE